MIGYLVRRIGQAIATILLVVSLVFVAVRVLPGNPLLARFGQHPDAEQIAKLRRDYGWDQPIYIQLGQFYWKLFTQGDLGMSLARSNVSVSRELRERVPATVELALAAIVIAVPLGVVAGLVAAVFRNRWPDRVGMMGALLGVSVPVFFLGICLRELFPGMPTSQRLPPEVFDFEPITGLYLFDTLLRGRWELWLVAAKHLVLPALTLSTIPMAIIARITRSSVLDCLSADFVRTATAKGAGRWRVVLRHVLPSAAVPITNITGLQVGALLSGAVLTETVFDWPGLGQYITTSVLGDKDYVAAQGAAIVIAVLFVSLNVVLDVIYVWLDPRIRLE